MNKAEKAKAYREELKAEGYCPRCYKRKAVAGKLHCKECEKYYYAYYHAHKAQRLEYAKQRREKLKAAGLCTQCGKRQQEKGLLCIECYPMRRKTPCFSYGDIRRVHRIYASN